MQRTTPLYSEITSLVPAYGEQGKRIDARAFAFAVVNVHLARMVRTESFGRTQDFTTSGVWVLIEGAAEAKRESLTLTTANWLGPSGISYALSQRFSILPGLLPNQRLEPGLPKPVLLAFEVPESEVSGATLLVPRNYMTPLDEEIRMPVTNIDTNAIHAAITLKRSTVGLPWILETE
ncbi:hypothetical protein EET67_04595 [Pseudaminobacter arsenicus]|uniref:Uncharacterized protein n=1 Tax=Borborobacter arsenicus TaxID=1851146 RepID=A0A432V9Q2_9HYPH|nr:hypothetical protein [Pseudaminobacter arsenicus]RUM98928.1 hypothetical protein EET67_04595 [Pseudaminobacter arsenicus]